MASVLVAGKPRQDLEINRVGVFVFNRVVHRDKVLSCLGRGPPITTTQTLVLICAWVGPAARRDGACGGARAVSTPSRSGPDPTVTAQPPAVRAR
jgi:hypothetical protein